MLELVIGQVLGLAKIPLGHELQVRPLVVALQPLIDDLPAHLAGREHVADPGRVVPVAPHRADLLVPVRMLQREPVARGLGDDAVRPRPAPRASRAR